MHTNMGKSRFHMSVWINYSLWLTKSMSHLLFEILSGIALDLKHRTASDQFSNLSPPSTKLGLQKHKTQRSCVLNMMLTKSLINTHVNMNGLPVLPQTVLSLVWTSEWRHPRLKLQALLVIWTWRTQVLVIKWGLLWWCRRMNEQTHLFALAFIGASISQMRLLTFWPVR